MSVEDYAKEAIGGQVKKIKQKIIKTILPFIIKGAAIFLVLIIIIVAIQAVVISALGLEATTYASSGSSASSGMSSVGSTGVIGNEIHDKIWYTLRAAGYSAYAVAGVMGNIWGESGYASNNLEDDQQGYVGHTDQSYTDAIDDGDYDLEKFKTDHRDRNPAEGSLIGAGYGLCQWTWETRKAGLYKYAKEIKKVSIADEDMQIEYLLGELSKTGGASGCATFQLGETCHGYTYENWYNAKSCEEATKAFMLIFERPKDISDTAVENRTREAQAMYDKYTELEKKGLGTYKKDDNSASIVGTYSSFRTGKNFYIYNQTAAGSEIKSIIGWDDECNRAAAASIISAYHSNIQTDPLAPIKYADKFPDGILYLQDVTTNFFDDYGLTAVTGRGDTYSYANLKKWLSQGKMVAIHIKRRWNRCQRDTVVCYYYALDISY